MIKLNVRPTEHRYAPLYNDERFDNPPPRYQHEFREGDRVIVTDEITAWDVVVPVGLTLTVIMTDPYDVWGERDDNGEWEWLDYDKLTLIEPPINNPDLYERSLFDEDASD